jgi:hypothetical protein
MRTATFSSSTDMRSGMSNGISNEMGNGPGHGPSEVGSFTGQNADIGSVGPIEGSQKRFDSHSRQFGHSARAMKAGCLADKIVKNDEKLTCDNLTHGK